MAELMIAWTVFCVVHSITASLRFKGMIAGRWPGVSKRYEYFYVLQSFALFGVIGLFYVRAASEAGAGEIVWRLPMPVYLNYALAFVSFAMVGLTKVTARSIIQPQDLREVLKVAASPFIKTGAYAVCRHPMYLFISLGLFFLPLNRVQAVSAMFIAGYFYIGTYLEEAKLMIEFGDEYREYQKDVSRFIPFKYVKKHFKIGSKGA